MIKKTPIMIPPIIRSRLTPSAVGGAVVVVGGAVVVVGEAVIVVGGTVVVVDRAVVVVSGAVVVVSIGGGGAVGRVVVGRVVVVSVGGVVAKLAVTVILATTLVSVLGLAVEASLQFTN
jgi:hypothetical protein